MAFYIILTGLLVAIPCALLGSLLMLRKMAMVGDAISHAVLPGIVIAYLVSGSRDSLLLLFSAVLVGMLCTWLIQLFHEKAGLQSDAAIGVSFTSLFAIGVILISAFANQIDLDQDCVLYGEIAYAPLDLIIINGINIGPRQAWYMAIAALVTITFIILFYKELQLLSFDQRYANTTGLNINWLNQAIMLLVSLTTVLAFESVGAILVVALLVVPAATAWLLTNNFKTLLIASTIISMLSTLLGYGISTAFYGSVAAAIAIATGLFFIAALIYSKRRQAPLQKTSIPA